MKDATRRDALRLSAVGTVALAASATASAQEKEELKGSGETALAPTNSGCKIDLSKGKVRTLAGGVGTTFSRMSPDPKPGDNTLTITGLPAGTRGITAWVTEWTAGNGGSPHAGGAFFYTTSVQLYDNGQSCRVRFRMDWNTNLPAAAQVMFSS